MPRDDFSRRPQKVTTTTPQRRRGDPYGVVVPDDDLPSQRQPIHFTGMQALGLLGITVIVFILLSAILGINIGTLALSVLIGFAVYELWYIMFEASS
ncbi:MAG TPA: hypothetical protein VHP83_11015 [Aggregatilineaceae bacterium]|nr:hypothetical protein [Aggregatilineaceae bacterium]